MLLLEVSSLTTLVFDHRKLTCILRLLEKCVLALLVLLSFPLCHDYLANVFELEARDLVVGAQYGDIWGEEPKVTT